LGGLQERGVIGDLGGDGRAAGAHYLHTEFFFSDALVVAEQEDIIELWGFERVSSRSTTSRKGEEKGNMIVALICLALFCGLTIHQEKERRKET
jgi:hypothetical protein